MVEQSSFYQHMKAWPYVLTLPIDVHKEHYVNANGPANEEIDELLNYRNIT